MIRNQAPWSMSTKIMPKKILTVGIAVGSLFLISSEVQAKDTKELAALKASATALSLSFGNLTDAELAQVLTKAITDNAKLNPASLTGEALKVASPNLVDPGSEVADAIDALPQFTADKSKFIGAAAVRAAGGAGANAANIPDFSAFLITTDADSLAAAKAAIKSKTAAGAIIGGRASQVADPAAITFANTALADPKLKAAATAISQYVIAESATPVSDVQSLANTNLKLLTKIVPGAVAGSPLSASDIVDSLLTQTTTQASAAKAASTLAKSIGLVADTEEVQQVGVEIAERMVSATPLIKLSKLNSIAKALVKGIINNPKPTATVGLDNQLDEIGEVAAYMLNAVSSATVFDDPKKGPKTVISFVKTLVKTAKKKGDKPAVFQKAAAQDIAGSVVETLQSLGVAVVADILTKLQDPKTANKIGGKKIGPSVGLGITEATGTLFPNKYEDGTNVNLGTVNEPTTDNRNS
jgi:hypothetical protein